VNVVSFMLTRQVQSSLHWFSRISQRLNSIICLSLYQFSRQPDNKCEKYTWKFIYIPKKSRTFTGPISATLAVTQYSSMDIYTKFYPNRIKNVQNMGKILLTPFTKGWFFTALTFTKFTEMLNGFMCKCYQVWKEWAEIHVCTKQGVTVVSWFLWKACLLNNFL
jgi:hypothetical protein